MNEGPVVQTKAGWGRNRRRHTQCSSQSRARDRRSGEAGERRDCLLCGAAFPGTAAPFYFVFGRSNSSSTPSLKHGFTSTLALTDCPSNTKEHLAGLSCAVSEKIAIVKLSSGSMIGAPTKPEHSSAPPANP
jgi:hypothetical protein